jgi:hypothetical protein
MSTLSLEYSVIVINTYVLALAIVFFFCSARLAACCWPSALWRASGYEFLHAVDESGRKIPTWQHLHVISRLHRHLFAPNLDTSRHLQDTLLKQSINQQPDSRKILGLRQKNISTVCLSQTREVVVLKAAAGRSTDRRPPTTCTDAADDIMI